MSLIFKFKASMTFDDVIIVSLQRPCNFDVSQSINSKFRDMGYFDLFSVKSVIYFQIQSLYNGKHKRPCNFAIFQDKKYTFGKLGYFDANFSKNFIIPNLKLL